MLNAFKRLKSETRRAFRQSTARVRRLPDFLIIGAQKGGSTSLYSLLAQHPQIRPARTKEVHYFSHKYGRGADWYRSQFPLRLGKSFITGEATPLYLFHADVPARVAQLLPDVKMIALLRDPVKRAYSHHQHQIRLGHERLSFEDALEAEPRRIGMDEVSYAQFSYLARGRYAEQLDNWFRHFPRESMLLLTAEEFFADPIRTGRTVQQWLGVDPFDIQDSSPRNRGEYAAMSPETERQLRNYFAPHNQRLREQYGIGGNWPDQPHTDQF